MFWARARAREREREVVAAAVSSLLILLCVLVCSAAAPTDRDAGPVEAPAIEADDVKLREEEAVPQP